MEEDERDDTEEGVKKKKNIGGRSPTVAPACRADSGWPRPPTTRANNIGAAGASTAGR